jgi:hypothetical protein
MFENAMKPVDYGCITPLLKILTVAVSLIDGGNWSTRRKL